MEGCQPILSDNAKTVAKEHQGLAFYGKVTTYTDANNCKIAGLSGYGNDFFAGYYIWCVRDAGGGGAPPQGEKTRVTDYVSTDGSLTHNALTANLALNDEVMLIHPVLIEAVETGGYAGDIEIFDSFEYPSDAALRGVWIEGGGAANPVRDNTTSYEGQYSMQSAITVSVGHLYRLFPTRNMKTLANIGVASYSTVGGETIQFRLYDSGGKYSYWNITLAAATTWKYHNINPHSVPTGDGGTPADLSDIVEIRIANLTIGSTFNFDFIKFSSLVATKIGIGYDGLDDAVEEASSVRGHLLLINDNIEVPAKDATTDVHARDVIGKKDDTAQTTVGITRSIIAYVKGLLNQVALIKTATDKQAGESPTVGTATQNWNAAEADIVSIGTDDTKKFVHSLILSIDELTAGAVITIRMYMQTNGVERKVYDQDYTKGTDPDGLWVVNGTVGIHEVLRVTAQSDTAADDGKNIDYDGDTEAR